MKAPDVIYLDHQATTPVDPRVVEAMTPWWTERFGHPASRHHAYGWDAEKAVEDARATVASLLGVAHEEPGVAGVEVQPVPAPLRLCT